jgi:catechol 2,3-dioxygenase-like lactoylglutathione lyase family enzyme
MLRTVMLDHVTITAADPEESIRFYTELLGLERGPEWPGEVTMLMSGASTALAIAWWAKGQPRASQPPSLGPTTCSNGDHALGASNTPVHDGPPEVCRCR